MGTKKDKLTGLIDGDTLVFAACAANEYVTYWDDHCHSLHCDYDAAKQMLTSSIARIKRELHLTDLLVALSDKANWRKQIMAEYKANRKVTRKPVSYGPLRDFTREYYSCWEASGLEGDDVLGVLATHPTLVPGKKIIISIDKDMKTIPGLLVNYQHARDDEDWPGNIKEITTEEADRFHLFQTLTGDSTDGYPGCPGIGPVTAEKILEKDPTWAGVVAAFESKGMSEEVALRNAQVARICRYEDYDFKKGEVIPWHPKM